MKIPKNEGKTRYRLYGEDRFSEALRISKTKCPHLTQQLEKIIKDKKCTQAETQIAQSITGGLTI